uniref:Uncharacterized protein n=1 Tax=Caenorhabditis japonica TaxID=281687 RepID=A0A8R1I690_CAEJA
MDGPSENVRYPSGERVPAARPRCPLYEGSLYDRFENLIEVFWRIQVRKVLSRDENSEEESVSIKRLVDSVERETRRYKLIDNVNDCVDNREKFEAAGKKIENIITSTGSCPFETLDEYFSLTEDFQMYENQRFEEEEAEIETDRWEEELNELVAIVKKEFPVEELMMRMLKNRHLLTMRLVVSGINQSSINQEIAASQARRLLQELQKRRRATLEKTKKKRERQMEFMRRVQSSRKRMIARSARALRRYKFHGHKNGVVVENECNEKKWELEMSFQKKKRRVPHKQEKCMEMQSGDMRWNFRRFVYKSRILDQKKLYRARRMDVKKFGKSKYLRSSEKSRLWGLKMEDGLKETEFERLVRDFADTEEYDVTIDRKIEIISKIKNITLNDVKMKAKELQKRYIDKAVGLLVQTRLKDATDEHQTWLNSEHCKVNRSILRFFPVL